MASGLPPLEQRTIPKIWAAAVARDPGAVFLVWAGQETTYGEADAFVEATRQQLVRDGAERGAHIAVFLDNGPEYIWVLLALARIGAIAVPIHAEAQGQLLTHFVRSADCEAVVIAEKYLTRLRESIGNDSLKQAWILGDGSGTDPLPKIAVSQRMIEFTDEVDAEFPVGPEPRFNETVLLMFTSGTSGPSKAAVVAQAHPVTAAIAQAQAAGITPEDRMHTCLPMSHANAMWFTTYAAISAGASVALTPRFSVRGFWRDIVETGATQTSLLGSMLQLLWKREPSEEEDVKRVKSLFVVPFPTNPQDYEDRFGAKLMTLYGMSEWTPISLSRPGEGYDKPAGMAGPLRTDLNDIAILNDDDVPQPVGVVGEIAVRRHEPFTSFQGYYGRDAATLADWRNLWFHTGDHGYIGEDNYLYFVGRKSDSLRRRGENVSAGELEDLLLGCAGIKEVAVVAVPSDLGDMSEDDIAVFVTRTHAGVEASEIYEFAREHLPRFMRPRYVTFIDDLPRTATEKIRKDVLRKTARETLSTFHDAEKEAVR